MKPPQLIFIFSLPRTGSTWLQRMISSHPQVATTAEPWLLLPLLSAIKPQYHVLPHLLKGHGHLNSEDYFVAWLKDMELNTEDAEMFLHIGDKCLLDKYQLFKNRVVHWNEYVPKNALSAKDGVDLSKIPEIGSVSEFAIAVAIFLGFDEIYLLGFDHDWFNGLYNYFYDEKKEQILKPDQSKLAHVDAEFQMLRHAEIFKRYKSLFRLHQGIYNANANTRHYLDVFPKVEFEQLFK